MNLSRILWLQAQHRRRTMRHHRKQEMIKGYANAMNKMMLNALHGPLMMGISSRGSGKSMFNHNWFAKVPGGSSISYPTTTIVRVSPRRDCADACWVAKDTFRRARAGMKAKIAMKPATAKLP